MIEACARFTEDKMGKTQKHLVSVNCDHQCETCGWNPAEQKRRIETGEFKPVYTRRGWDEVNNCVIPEMPLPEGTRQLVFKRLEQEVEQIV